MVFTRKRDVRVSRARCVIGRTAEIGDAPDRCTRRTRKVKALEEGDTLILHVENRGSDDDEENGDDGDEDVYEGWIAQTGLDIFQAMECEVCRRTPSKDVRGSESNCEQDSHEL